MPKKKATRKKPRDRAMNRDEAIALLQRGQGGVIEWNELRSRHEELTDLGYADLSGADLRDAQLGGTILSHADLSRTKLNRANLSFAELVDAGLRDADLSGANLNGADLCGADLSGADLRDAQLACAKLTNAYLAATDLGGAKLSGADLNSAYLTGAKLTGADLSATDLRGTDLSGADLSNTDLGGANLRNARLSHADLSRAVARVTSITNVDLSDVVGLETVDHQAPSSVGIDTMVLSGGTIPESFLRGCGVPESFITYQRSLVANPIEFYSCFISHSHADKSFARRLHDQLQGRGIRCWLDEKALKPGDDIYQEVDRGIRLWDKVLLCASKASLGSWWVGREVETAIEKEKQLHRDRGRHVLSIIPLNVDGSLFEWDGSHAATLRKRVAADFTDWESDNAKFEASFEAVVDALRSDAAAKQDPPEPKL